VSLDAQGEITFAMDAFADGSFPVVESLVYSADESKSNDIIYSCNPISGKPGLIECRPLSSNVEGSSPDYWETPIRPRLLELKHSSCGSALTYALKQYCRTDKNSDSTPVLGEKVSLPAVWTK
jgi:hypothetical protein